MRTTGFTNALVAILSILPYSVAAHTVRAPATVRADPAGTAVIPVLIIAESAPAILASYGFGGPQLCTSGVADAFCEYTIATGETLSVSIEVRLCDPEVPGLCQTIVGFCDAEGRMAETHVFPYSGASVGEPVAGVLSLRNHPNPVRARTTFELALPSAGQVSLRVYDLLGRRLVSPLDEYREAGTSTFEWNATGADGGKLSPGVYVAKLETAGRVATLRFVVTN